MCRLGRLLPQATLHFCFVKVYSALLTRTGSPKNPWTLLSTLFSTRKNHFTPHRPRTEEVGAHYPPESFFKLLPTSQIHNENLTFKTIYMDFKSIYLIPFLELVVFFLMTLEGNTYLFPQWKQYPDYGKYGQ